MDATNRLELSPTYLSLDGLSSLKLLVASGNAITTVADNALTPVASTLAALDLRNNPLAWVRKRHRQVRQYSCTRCALLASVVSAKSTSSLR